MLQIAAVSGDIRRALDLLLRSTEIAEADRTSKLVKMAHLQQAIQEMLSSGLMLAVKWVSKSMISEYSPDKLNFAFSMEGDVNSI